ncbi:hypothetical protein [Maridesulfovibrio sp.]|uniref:hypothetical protein n=1 Tax=Maridesulfovibrio sp. TaxID=2795000 RepID=UPI0039F142EF
MKKILNISVVMAFILVMSSAAFAMDMNHSGHGKGEMKGSMHDGIAMMEKGLAHMKHGAKLMHDPATMKEGMGLMNKEMMPMHNGMKMIEKGAEGGNHHSMVKGSMGHANKGMMEMMKGMGLVKKGDDKGFQMMDNGLEKMEKSLEEVKGASGM